MAVTDRGPWFISEADAEARLLKTVAVFERDCARLLVDEMDAPAMFARLRHLYSERQIVFLASMSAALKRQARGEEP